MRRENPIPPPPPWDGPTAAASLRTGPLRNGNPRGNPNLAPRCGARTRLGCPCRGPAMSNGRCRMHGGASTGPRTPEGRARISAAQIIRHYGSPERHAFHRDTRAFIRGSHELLRTLRRPEARDMSPEDLLRCLPPIPPRYPGPAARPAASPQVGNPKQEPHTTWTPRAAAPRVLTAARPGARCGPCANPVI